MPNHLEPGKVKPLASIDRQEVEIVVLSEHPGYVNLPLTPIESEGVGRDRIYRGTRPEPWSAVMLLMSYPAATFFPVGSRAGAVLRRRGLSVSPRFLWECLTSRTVSPFPTPANLISLRSAGTMSA